MKSIRSLAAALALSALFAGAVHLGARPVQAADDAAALEGGKALPDGAWKITFPWMAKQSISLVSEADVERMAGVVSFAGKDVEALGTVTLDGKGGATGSFKVPVKEVTTGIAGRDEHMRGAKWLDAEKFPDITYTITKAEKVKPTVYRITGTWKMHGVEKEIVTLANVRFIEKMDHVPAPKGIARLKSKFTLSLKAFGLTDPSIGSPAVSDAWDVEMVVLGILGS